MQFTQARTRNEVWLDPLAVAAVRSDQRRTIEGLEQLAVITLFNGARIRVEDPEGDVGRRIAEAKKQAA
jgi:hypothetical protein